MLQGPQQRMKPMAGPKTVGETLVDLLEARGVDTVFGIPGVHTVELYRGLKTSNIRHVTPRHELSAGFMADGYARATGKPGVCLLITGPGLTNAITAMAQARADSIPMLVISGVNCAHTHGHEEGLLHELPDQIGMMRTVAQFTHTLHSGKDLERVLDRAFAAMLGARPGPVHIEIPIDVMSEQIAPPARPVVEIARPHPDPSAIAAAAGDLGQATSPVILAGGGSLHAEAALRDLAHRLDAPVVTTVNARGLLANDPLCVSASPSLPAVRALLASADVVLAVGTQFGPTDFDMYGDGNFPALRRLIRVDVDPLQLTRGATPDIPIIADADHALTALCAQLGDQPRSDGGAARAKHAREAAFQEIGPDYREWSDLLTAISAAVPEAMLVGDSTQLVYAGNMYSEISGPRKWFNSATGFGSLGYGAPAAVGASIGRPDCPVICITGDGGFQFCLSELGTAMDEDAPVVFLVWNNSGYGEIENYMLENAIAPIGVRPTPPDFPKLAAAYGLPSERVSDPERLPAAIADAVAGNGPCLVEFVATK